MPKEKRQPWSPLLCSYPDSEKINNVSFEAETLYTRLIAASDDNANYDAKPTLLMCGVFKKRFDAGLVDVTKTERLRNELVSANLIKLYKVNGGEYLHILKCKKHLRKDINPDIRFPVHPQQPDNKEDTESVTKTERLRNENAPSNTTPNTNTNTNTKPMDGVVKSPEQILELDLQISKYRSECLKQLDSMFHFNQRETTTFANILKFLSDECQTGKLTPDVFNNVVRWAKAAKVSTATNKKGLLVKKIQKETGYTGNGKLL